MVNIQWTNPSVKKFSGSSDPTLAIIQKTRSYVLDLIDSGWQGPPFDIFSLAKSKGFSVIPREDVLDARLVCNKGQITVEYNPNRSMSRIRFSIAHEIAHTFFPDFHISVKNRNGEPERSDDWQLELLCNISASEILMPVGLDINQEKIEITVEKAKQIRDRFDVSMEAALLRLGRLTTKPVTIFAAARENDSKKSDFRVDYVVSSPESTAAIEQGMRIPSTSVLSECTAIGFTAVGRERWAEELPEFNIECIGIPPYPSHLYPRILGIITTLKKHNAEPLAIRYLMGDATEPRGQGRKIIAHIVNDSSRNWGKGFGLAVSLKWPAVSKDFHIWVAKNKNNLKLGSSHFFQVAEDIGVFHMIAQRGYGPSTQPRIRYQSLSKCLDALAETARDTTASVHMPRIGTGYAGGNWSVIKEMINDALIKRGIEVTVYDLPGRESSRKMKTLSDFDNPLDSW